MLNDQFGNRRFVIGGLMVVVVVIYIIRLFNLQILDDSYTDKADSNAFLKEIEFRYNEERKELEREVRE